MKVGELNGYEIHVPTSGGKAGKGRAKTSTIQVRKDCMIVKVFRFTIDNASSRIAAMLSAKSFIKKAE